MIGFFAFVVVFVVFVVAAYIPMGVICWLAEKPKIWTYRRFWKCAGVVGGAAWCYLMNWFFIDKHPWPQSLFVWALCFISYGWSMYLFGLGLSFGFIVRRGDLDPKGSIVAPNQS